MGSSSAILGSAWVVIGAVTSPLRRDISIVTLLPVNLQVLLSKAGQRIPPRTWAKLPEAHLFYFAMTCVSPGTSKSEDKTNGQLESHARRTLYAPYIPFKGPSPEYSSLTEPCKDPLKGSQNGRTPFDASPGAGRTGARLFA